MCALFYFVLLIFIILFDHYSIGKRAPLERFLVAEGIKSAIFGSYNYDPVKQIFELSQDNSTIKTTSIHQIVNDTFVHSTALGISNVTSLITTKTEMTPTNHLVFRKRNIEPWWQALEIPSKNLTSVQSKTLHDLFRKFALNK